MKIKQEVEIDVSSVVDNLLSEIEKSIFPEYKMVFSGWVKNYKIEKGELVEYKKPITLSSSNDWNRVVVRELLPEEKERYSAILTLQKWILEK